MRLPISIRGYVRLSVRWSIGPSLCLSGTRFFKWANFEDLCFRMTPQLLKDDRIGFLDASVWSVCPLIRPSVRHMFFPWANNGWKWSDMTGKTVLMLQTRQKVFWIVPKCPTMSDSDSSLLAECVNYFSFSYLRYRQNALALEGKTVYIPALES